MTWVALALVVVLNPMLTPGAVRPLTKEQVCAIHWRLDRRHVTQAMKREVFRRYGVPWADRSQYEVDHLISRSLSGSDTLENLWIQPWADAHRKDRLEVHLSKLVCGGWVPLVDAQRMLRADWVAAYQQYFSGEKKP